ncbi:MAG: hypothetical protein WD075_01605 [Rhodospirillales bacterium]
MMSIITMLTTTIGITLAVAAFLLAVLALRNPHNPSWVFGEAFSQLTALLMTTGISAALAVAVESFYSVGMNVATALCVTAGIAVVTGAILYALFDIGERMRRADAGRSTFERVSRDSAVPNNKAGAF